MLYIRHAPVIVFTFVNVVEIEEFYRTIQSC